jgi:uncharacterized protein YggE
MRFSVLFSVAGLATAQAQSQEPALSSDFYPRTEVRTTATATRPIAPDLAVLRFEFSAKDTTPSRAARAAAVIGESVRKAVAKAGIPEDSIRGRGSLAFPADQAVQMEIRQNSEFRRYDTTYAYRDLIEVRVHDLDRVARVIDAALAAGAQKMVLLQFSSTKVQQTGQDLLAEATRQARRNAEIMAKESGGRLGRPLEVTTDRSESGNPFYDLRSTHGTGTNGFMATPPSAEVRVSVFGRWELLAADSTARR